MVLYYKATAGLFCCRYQGWQAVSYKATLNFEQRVRVCVCLLSTVKRGQAVHRITNSSWAITSFYIAVRLHDVYTDLSFSLVYRLQ